MRRVNTNRCGTAVELKLLANVVVSVVWSKLVPPSHISISITCPTKPLNWSSWRMQMPATMLLLIGKVSLSAGRPSGNSEITAPLAAISR